jgi:hypothetical protein
MSVIQDWAEQLSYMQQSVLIAAVRGPDGIEKDHPVKVLCRWLRRSFLISAFERRALIDPYEPGGGRSLVRAARTLFVVWMRRWSATYVLSIESRTIFNCTSCMLLRSLDTSIPFPPRVAGGLTAIEPWSMMLI